MIHYKKIKNNLKEGIAGQTSRQLWGMVLYSGAYSLEYAMYGIQEGVFGNNVGFYTGGAHQKVGVFSHKMLFYSLGIE